MRKLFGRIRGGEALVPPGDVRARLPLFRAIHLEIILFRCRQTSWRNWSGGARTLKRPLGAYPVA
jgi:hypothetical protein